MDQQKQPLSNFTIDQQLEKMRGVFALLKEHGLVNQIEVRSSHQIAAKIKDGNVNENAQFIVRGQVNREQADDLNKFVQACYTSVFSDVDVVLAVDVKKYQCSPFTTITEVVSINDKSLLPVSIEHNPG